MNQEAEPPKGDIKDLAEASLARRSGLRQSAYEVHAERLVQQFAPTGDPRELDLVADQLMASAADHAGSRKVLIELAAAVRRLARV